MDNFRGEGKLVIYCAEEPIVLKDVRLLKYLQTTRKQRMPCQVCNIRKNGQFLMSTDATDAETHSWQN